MYVQHALALRVLRFSAVHVYDHRRLNFSVFSPLSYMYQGLRTAAAVAAAAEAAAVVVVVVVVRGEGGLGGEDEERQQKQKQQQLVEFYK